MKQNKTAQKRRKKNPPPRVEPRTSCMRSLLLLYCATSHRTNKESQLVIPTVSSLVITYSFHPVWKREIIKFLGFPMQCLFENHIFFISLTKMIKNYDKTFLNIR